MKNYAIRCVIILTAMFFLSAESIAQEPSSRQLNIESPACSQEVEDLYARLDAINEMDKSDLPREDKKALREEVKSIKQRLQELGNGVYISAGALIVILILLIVLL